MSDLYKEWQDVLRDYIERESKLNSYEYNPDNIKEFVKPRTLSESEEVLKLMRSHNLTNQSEQDYDK